MTERLLTTRGIRLCYDVRGSDADPAVLLVMGLNLQLVWWREAFCEQLCAQGLRVIRMDNRDVGRSSRLVGPGPTALQFLRRSGRASYSLADMADDCAAVVSEAAPEGAHVVGVSLGSFIAQELAIRHPAQVRSLVSIMGRPGDGKTGKVALRMLPEFLRPAPADPVEGLVQSFRRIGSTFRTDHDDQDVRDTLRQSQGRAADDSGGGRQLAAILAERDRTTDLRGLRLPALVVHGLADRVVRPSGGRATAAAIPGAELLEIDGMGHDLARQVWPTIVDGIARTAARA
jgi:pimeloyl-ACP methyl ester carboxylesterase